MSDLAFLATQILILLSSFDENPCFSRYFKRRYFKYCAVENVYMAAGGLIEPCCVFDSFLYSPRPPHKIASMIELM